MALRKIGIVVGHNQRAQGAVRVTDGVSEFVWCSKLAEMIRALNPEQIGVFHREHNPSGVGAEVRAVYAEVDAWGAYVTCELHFNSFNASATGTETLYATNAGKLVAIDVQKAMLKALGLRDRGLVHRQTGNGAPALLAGRAPAVLIEPYFGSNPADCHAADAGRDLLAFELFTALGGVVTSAKGPKLVRDEPAPRPPVGETLYARIAAVERRLDAAGF